MSNNTIECIATVERIRFFKNNYGIISCSINKIKSGELAKTVFKNDVIFKGTMPSPVVGNCYNIKANFESNDKWGDQYNILSMFTAVSFDTADGKRKFLETIFTPYQIENMYNALADPFTALDTRNYTELVKIKGCGLSRCTEWADKFAEHIGMARILLELGDFDLTNRMVKKLMDRYRSPDVVVEKVKNNPYVLCTEVNGIGFKKADEIAMKGGISPNSVERIKAYITYYLTECGENGQSWITPDHLLGAILDTLGENIPDNKITESIRELIEEKRLWVNEDKTKLGLQYYYDLATNIATELIRLRDAECNFKYDGWEDVIKRNESLQGWEYTDEQIDAIKSSFTNNVMIITGGAGCVDCDTEFFDGYKWKKISEYQNGDKVLQYNLDGTANLVSPLDYIKQPYNCLYHFETKYGVNQTLSPDHNVFYISQKGKPHLESFNLVKEKIKNCKFHGKFLTSFKYSGNGINYSDDMIRLLVAIFADGSFHSNANPTIELYFQCRFHLKKQRKKDRLVKLLNNLNYSYREKQSSAIGYTDYYIQAPIREKHFPTEWYNCSQHQLRIIAEEVMNWDGAYKEQNRYSTSCKSDADFIQFVFSAIGYRATILTNNRLEEKYMTNNKEHIRKSIDYTVSWTERTLVGLNQDKRERTVPTKVEQIKPIDGYGYCFIVPSHLLVLRRNDKIFITGNCGKTSTVSAILEVFKNHSHVLCALSGQACSVLASNSGEEGFTIHRLLGFPQGDKQGFVYHDDNPLPYDIVVVDEISMIGAKLFYCLLRAIPTGSKVIMLGDDGQLESIGCGNVASNMLASPEIHHNVLTKIHRQAAKSAIITESIKARQGIPLIAKDWAGSEIRGELEDFNLICYSDASNTYYKILEEFQKIKVQPDFNVMETQVIVPMKTKGMACVAQLNNILQEMCNPADKKKKETTVFRNGRQQIIREGDKVICKKNNYRIQPNIFNGSTGILKKFDFNDFGEPIWIINFRGIGEVIIPDDYWDTIELNYCGTVHSNQGSQYDNVIVGLDFGAYTLLTRELVYTAITRAKKKCIVIAQNSALRYAVGNKGLSKKQTHLVETLYNVTHPKLDF